MSRYLGRPAFQALADAAVFLAQSEEDAKRLAEMGAPDERIEITGNLKYDAEPPVLGAFGEWLCKQIQQQERWPVVIAGSVVEGERDGNGPGAIEIRSATPWLHSARGGG